MPMPAASSAIRRCFKAGAPTSPRTQSRIAAGRKIEKEIYV